MIFLNLISAVFGVKLEKNDDEALCSFTPLLMENALGYLYGLCCSFLLNTTSLTCLSNGYNKVSQSPVH
jgi:hypothetical protein